jgi:hypothetical protein
LGIDLDEDATRTALAHAMQEPAVVRGIRGMIADQEIALGSG